MLIYLLSCNWRWFLTGTDSNAKCAQLALSNQLQELEATLKKFNLWQYNKLSVAQVTNPFGVGQISFSQWLQFIYLPKMRLLITSGQTVPVANITPYAEEVLAGHEARTALLRILASLDNLSAKCHEPVL